MHQTSSQNSSTGFLKFFRNLSFSQILGYTVLFFIVRFFAVAIYRIYFHPLSKFPGPKLRAATRIPTHIETWTGKKHLKLSALHRKYGHVVRVNHDELSWTEPNAWKDIYGHGTKNTAGSMPHKAWAKYGNSLNGSFNLLQARDTDHNRMRKVFNPAFSDRALKQQEPLLLRYTDQLVSKLRESVEEDPDKPFDMVRMFNFTTFDIMGDLTFGEPLHMLESAEYDPWVSTIFSSIVFSAKLSILTNYPRFWIPFKYMVRKTLNKKRRNHFDHSVTRVTKRLEKGRDSEGVDLWDFVLDQKEGQGLSRAEMDSNASLFMIAGTETTATLVSGLTYHLTQNPESMKKLAKEIRDAFPSTNVMTMERLAALPYLSACLKEAFRLYPPVPLGLPRITPADGSTVCGQFIPPHTILTMPQLATYTHEKNFKQPLEFIPERWLGEEKFETDKRQALQPFSMGSRDCLGKNLAYHEMRLIMAKLLYAFDVELDSQCKDWADQNTYLLWQKKPLMCKLRLVAKS